jgi:hypothetical protein
MYKNPPKLNKYISIDISKDKSFLDILDSVEELKEDEIKITKDTKKCKCCNKFIVNNIVKNIVKNIEDHQTMCFQKKIKELENKVNNLELMIKLREKEIVDETKHSIRIKGLELLIERNNQKWNKVMNKKMK